LKSVQPLRSLRSLCVSAGWCLTTSLEHTLFHHLSTYSNTLTVQREDKKSSGSTHARTHARTVIGSSPNGVSAGTLARRSSLHGGGGRILTAVPRRPTVGLGWVPQECNRGEDDRANPPHCGRGKRWGQGKWLFREIFWHHEWLLSFVYQWLMFTSSGRNTSDTGCHLMAGEPQTARGSSAELAEGVRSTWKRPVLAVARQQDTSTRQILTSHRRIIP
jgi:hypothetical protein